MLHVAVVGAGPSGVFAAAELLTRPDVEVDVLDRLPTPFGLVRYGVAPDHLKIKSVASTLSTVLSDPRVRFHGNVEYGVDVTLADLRAVCGAVVFATGAPVANRLGIPGEGLPGSFTAADIVPWYNGHPAQGRPWAGPTDVAVIGGGNVALDVVRVLLKGGAGLQATDIPEAVARALDAYPVTDVHLVVRRGVADVKFTPAELLELERLDLDILVDPADMVLTQAERERARTQRIVGHRVAVFSRWAERPRRAAPSHLRIHFRRSPVKIVGDERVRGICLQGGDTGLEPQLLPIGAVIAAVGYRSRPLPDVAFDPGAGGTVTHSSGRVEPGVYVAGWFKRGPSGVIGSNKRCAVDSVRALLADFDADAIRPPAKPGGLANLLGARGRAVVDWAGWQRIDEAERVLGAGTGRARAKITERARLVRIGTGTEPASEEQGEPLAGAITARRIDVMERSCVDIRPVGSTKPRTRVSAERVHINAQSSRDDMTYSVSSLRTPPEGYAWSRFGEPEYTDWLDESLSWKNTCSIGDWSFVWQHRITGPDALAMLGDITVNSLASFALGQSKHAIHTNQDGKVIHEGVLTRFGAEEFVLHGRGGFWADHYLRKSQYDAKIVREDWFILQIAGPNSLKVLEKVAGPSNLRDTGFMRIGTITVAGHEIWSLRQGMSGEIGFELQGPMNAKEEIYKAIVEAGQEFGIRKLGGRAALINHLEACFPTIATDYIPAIFGEDMGDYLREFTASMPAFAQPAHIAGSYDGAEISDYYRSPVELGWGRNIKFDHDFLGRAALEAEKTSPRRVMRTLVWDGDDVAKVFASLFQKGEHYPFMEMPRDQRGFMWADSVSAGDELVGVATSRGYSYSYRQMLSLCTIDVSHSEPGTEVIVHWGEPGGPQKAVRATVAPAPYKPDRRRADLHRA